MSLHVRPNLQFWIRNQWPRDTHCFGVCSWEGAEAKPGMSECEDSASLVGRELMRPLLGNSPETPAIGLLNQQHVQCTSRRGIWHLNFPWTFHHHHLQLLHKCGQPRAAGRSSKAAQQRGAGWAAEPPPGAPWLSRLPAEDCPLYASVCACRAGLRDRPPRSPVAGWAFPSKLVCYVAWSQG